MDSFSLAQEEKTAFVVYAYDKPTIEPIVQQIKNILEKMPSRFRVRILKFDTAPAELFITSLINLIRECGLGVVILDELKCNICFELGMLYALEKDLILLARKDSLTKIKKNFSDIISMRITLYDPTVWNLEQIIEDEVKRLEDQRRRKIEERFANPEYLLSVGDVHFFQGNYREAIIKYQASIQSKPDFAEALVRLGDAYHAIYDLTKSEEAYRHALKLSSKNPVIFERLGQVLLDSGKYEDALECYLELIKITPENDNYFFGAIVSLNELQNLEKTVSLFQEWSIRFSEKASLFYDMSWTYIRFARIEEKPAERESLIKKSLSMLEKSIHLNNQLKKRAAADRDFDFIRKMDAFKILIQ